MVDPELTCTPSMEGAGESAMNFRPPVFDTLRFSSAPQRWHDYRGKHGLAPPSSHSVERENCQSEGLVPT